MKLKATCLAISAMLLSTTVFSATKYIDFYSTNGNNRYSISGEIKDLKLNSDKNTILVPEANADAYITINNKLPYHLRFIENDLNVSQIIEVNKGKTVKYKGEDVKLVSFQGNNFIVESPEGILFVPVSEIVLNKDLLMNSSKGLQATFKDEIKSDDKLFYSQVERNLRYTNTYSARLNGDKINLAHYFDINNNSNKTFENVSLNFFLSETNIKSSINFPVMARAMVAAEMKVVEEPMFEKENIQNLKTIMIKEPVSIYPNMNKIKYSDKKYNIEQYAKFQIEKKNEIYLGNLQNNEYLSVLKEGTKANMMLKEQIKNLKNNLINNILATNIINIKIENGDILPSGRIDIYENVKGIDKLIVSTSIPYTENEDLEILKNKNSDLKINKIVFNDLEQANVVMDLERYSKVDMFIKSIEVENIGNVPYTINIFNKKVKINPNSKVIITA